MNAVSAIAIVVVTQVGGKSDGKLVNRTKRK